MSPSGGIAGQCVAKLAAALLGGVRVEGWTWNNGQAAGQQLQLQRACLEMPPLPLFVLTSAATCAAPALAVQFFQASSQQRGNAAGRQLGSGPARKGLNT